METPLRGVYVIIRGKARSQEVNNEWYAAKGREKHNGRSNGTGVRANPCSRLPVKWFKITFVQKQR
jgi:hypothetical protein